MQAEFTALRSQVDSVVGSLREQVDSLQQQAAGDTLEAWTQAATTIQEQEGELLMELDRLNSVELDEARDIRSDIASQLANLEGDVVRRQVQYTAGPGFTGVALALEERLSRLEQTLDSVVVRLETHGPVGDMEIRRPSGEATEESVDDPPPPPGDTMEGRVTAEDLDDPTLRSEALPDADRILELREEIQSVRGELEGLREAEDLEEWNDAKEEIAEQVAELTREVRQHWYNLRYSFRDVTAMEGAGATGLPRGEE